MTRSPGRSGTPGMVPTLASDSGTRTAGQPEGRGSLDGLFATSPASAGLLPLPQHTSPACLVPGYLGTRATLGTSSFSGYPVYGVRVRVRGTEN
jgi:hypothetical protein